MADLLTTAYHKKETSRLKRPQPNPLFFPTTRCSWLVNGHQMTSKFTEAIRFHIMGTSHWQYLQGSKKGWEVDGVWNSVDMEILGYAMLSLNSSQRITQANAFMGGLRCCDPCLEAKVQHTCTSTFINCDNRRVAMVNSFRGKDIEKRHNHWQSNPSFWCWRARRVDSLVQHWWMINNSLLWVLLPLVEYWHCGIWGFCYDPGHIGWRGWNIC